MNTLFPISVALYFAATLICFAGASFRKARLTQIAICACRCGGMVDTGDLKSPGREAVPVRIGPPAPKRRESEQDSLLFGGQPAAGKDPLRSIIWEGITDPLPGPPHADLIAGSDCRDEPDMKQETAVKYRFPGLFCALCTVLCRKNQRGIGIEKSD